MKMGELEVGAVTGWNDRVAGTERRGQTKKMGKGARMVEWGVKKAICALVCLLHN